MTPLGRLRLTRLPGVVCASTRADFHVRRAARDAHGWDESLFTLRGDVVFTSLAGAHRFVLAVNQKDPGAHLQASEVNAMGLIHEVFHAVIRRYRSGVPGAFGALTAGLREALGDDLDRTLLAFVDAYPPPAVYKGELTVAEYLAGSQDGTTNIEWALEELVLSWLGNENPAYAPIAKLVSDADLRRSTRYLQVMETTRAFFADQPRFGPDHQSLIDMLLEPIRRAPTSLIGQLEFMRDHWGLDVELLRKLLLAGDFVKEEGKWFLRHEHADPSWFSVPPPTFEGPLYEDDPERFSPDRDWMPRVVMIAKSTLVWLDQLAQKYERRVNTLADVPDEELALLARRGFTALWLIGVWRRSAASATIKRMMGDADAAASAYSLDDYEIAPDLGGAQAYADLKRRAARRGLRLASDMVPNHMGIDSSWVNKHPDWFLQTKEPPFPAYSFNGPDLGSEERVGIFLEDGYWTRRDAAICFKRLDKWTGDARYILHGNDGTSMPWNDTAQLDYLNPAVREGVIQTILHVARMFPIIRFDAAMTLAKRQFQRLWFPVPGSGGDIPSRAAHAMARERFDELFPVEFWREVVDRVAAEVPDTLLLAEAFWMMEGFFVRTLGMHRVYNSAFMNMLKKEENASFRLSIRNVLEFNPQILKRHVNFMNNPDEETAVAQFGKDDKYFGVCTVMCTMPGLPMFGHGQVEGFTEKYGMEYTKARWEEQPDGWLVARHEREIFPLLQKRALFSDVEEFRFYDFFTEDGHVDEDVFAYSNRREGERALVAYHNKFKEARGWIKTSVGFLEGAGITQRTLAQGLALSSATDAFTVMRDHVTGLEILRENAELIEKGLFVVLGAFKYQLLWQMREVVSTQDKPYRALAAHLAGGGVPSVDDALVALVLKAVHDPFWEAVSPGSAAYLLEEERREVVNEKLENMAKGIEWMRGEALDVTRVAERLLRRYARLLSLLAAGAKKTKGGGESAALDSHRAVAWMYASALDGLRDEADYQPERVLLRAFREAGVEEDVARRRATMVSAVASRGTELAALLEAPEIRAALHLHTFDGVAYFHKESFEELLSLLADIAALDGATAPPRGLAAAAADSGYRFLELIAIVRRDASRVTPPPSGSHLQMG
jgi:glycosidase